MFRAIALLVAALLAAQSTLQNGINVSELPSDTAWFEVIAGYRAGVRNETEGTSGLAAATSAFLSSSIAGRQLALAAYGAGGEFEFFSELDRTGVRLRVPAWARPMVEPLILPFLAESPSKDPGGTAYAIQTVRERARALDVEFQVRVEDEIRTALLGSRPYHHAPGGWTHDLDRITAKDMEAFFSQNYGTHQAFVLMSGPALQALSELPQRAARDLKIVDIRPLKAERHIKLPDQESGGAVILASPLTSVFYRDWYSVLMLDRLIKDRVAPNMSSSLTPSLDPYYYRIEVPVPSGQFDNQVQESFLQEMERLQFVRPTDQQLSQARNSAIQYLESPRIKYWFLSLGIPERREEGLDWVRTFTADDMRITARELLLSNRVIASWSPKAKQLRVQTESLGASSASRSNSEATSVPVPAPQRVRPPEFPAHAHEEPLPTVAGNAGLPAIPLLKALLDRKLIEAGLWNDAQLGIGGLDSSRLLVSGNEIGRQHVVEWLKEIGVRPPSDEDVTWAREAAIHRRDLPSVAIADLNAVTSEQLQDAARIYFVN